MYFLLENDLDPKIVGGEYPQTDCLTMAQAHLISAWKLFDPEPQLKFLLKKGAIVTNVLSDATISATGFLVDKKCLSVFRSFNLMRHQVMDAPVASNGVTMEYYWLHLSEPELTKKLDYNRSTFYRTEYTFREEPIQLQSYEQYELLKKEDEDASFGIELGEISFSQEFDKGLDLFTFLPFDQNIYISERLKAALDQEKITGFSIKKATNIMDGFFQYKG